MERFAVGAWQPSCTPPAWLSEEQRAEENEDLNTFLKNPQDFKTLGNGAFNKGQFYRALELYDQALTRLDTFETEESQQLGLRASLHYSRACAHYKVKNFKLAAQQAGECLQIDPGHQKAVKIMQELAPNLLAAQRKPTAEVAEALEDTMQERTSEHRLVKGLLQMKDDANAALVRGNVQEAVRMYNKTFSRMEEVKQEVGLVALDSSQLKATLYANRSQAHISLGQWKEAKADACSCLEIQPGHPKALHRLKLAEDGLSKIQATTDHGEALKNALFYKNTGNKQFGEGHNKAAVEDYTSGLDWLEDLPSDDAAVHDVRIALYSNRALAYLKLKAWSNAVGDADHILSLDPSHRKAKFRRAKALTEMGIFHEAIVELRALSDADPNNEDISEALRHAEAQARLPLDFADAEDMVPDARDAVAERRRTRRARNTGQSFKWNASGSCKSRRWRMQQKSFRKRSRRRTGRWAIWKLLCSTSVWWRTLASERSTPSEVYRMTRWPEAIGRLSSSSAPTDRKPKCSSRCARSTPRERPRVVPASCSDGTKRGWSRTSTRLVP